MIKWLKRLLTIIKYEISKRKNTQDTNSTENGIEQRPDRGGAGDAHTDSLLLDKKTERRGDEHSEGQQGGATPHKATGRRCINEVWSFAECWNNHAIADIELKPKPRNYLRGSDLGKPMSDVYLKMKGIEYTNPPNDRSLRKFESGNIWESIVKLVLIRADLYRSTQDEVEFQYPDCLKVTGHPDFIAGGMPNLEKAKANLSEIPLPPVFAKTSVKVIEYLLENYPDGLEEIVLEIKSTSGDFFNILERSGKALKMHRLQLYNYLKSTGRPKGAIIYISRDDARILTIPILNPTSSIEQEYHDYIEQMTYYFKNDIMPPLEQPIVFDPDMQKIKKNSMLGWSPYLTKLYGYKDQKEFDDIYTPMQAAFTRVITRIQQGKPLTNSNLEYIAKMQEMGFNPYQIAKISYADNN